MLRKALPLILTWMLILPLGVAMAQADGQETLIGVNIEIFDISDSYFERLGMDLETLFSSVESAAAENQSRHTTLTPLEDRLLKRLMKKEDCVVLQRRDSRVRPLEKLEMDNNPPPISVGAPSPPLTHLGKDREVKWNLNVMAIVATDGNDLNLKIAGQSQWESSLVEATLPEGKTLLVRIGSHVVEERLVQATPILGKVPHVSRYYKNTGVARQVWHRLVFIRPRVVNESKSDAS